MLNLWSVGFHKGVVRLKFCFLETIFFFGLASLKTKIFFPANPFIYIDNALIQHLKVFLMTDFSLKSSLIRKYLIRRKFGADLIWYMAKMKFLARI